MIIKELYLENFGKFKHKSVVLQPGLNLISGGNEAGKTTIHAFVRAMLFGIPKKRGRSAEQDTYARYIPWDSPDCFKGMMRFESDGVTYRMERNFTWAKRSLTVIRESDGAVLSEREQNELFGGFQESSYAGTVSIGQFGAKPGEELETTFQEYVVNLASTKNAELSTKRAIEILQKKKKDILTGIKSGTMSDLKTLYLNERAKLETYERQESDYCIRMEEKRQAKLSMETEIASRKRAVEKAQGEIDRMSQELEDLKVKQQDAIVKSIEMEKKYNELSGQAKEGKEELCKKYGFESLEQAAEMIMKEKRRSSVGIVPVIALLLCIVAAIVSFVFVWDAVYTIIAIIGVMVCAVWMILSIALRAKKREKKLDFYDEGRMAFVNALEAEKSAERANQEWVRKKELADNLETRVSDRINQLLELEHNIPRMPAEEEQLLKQVETEIQRLKWELDRLNEQQENCQEEVERLRKTIEQVKAKEEEAKAIEMAIENIQNVAESIKSSFGTALNEKTSAYAAAITQGKYTKVAVDSHMNITVFDGTNCSKVSQLSAGTIEQMYLALRLAAADIIFSEERKPVLLDDALVMYDNKRMAAALRCLAENVEQVLLFSCHTREKAVLDATGIAYHLIQL